MKLRRNEGERKTAKPNLAKQINSTVAVSEPPETVNPQKRKANVPVHIKYHIVLRSA
jgi:hypothetical protein